MRRLWLVLLLPVIGLAGSIVHHGRALGGASVWRIPVTGIDPRDPLRGQYVDFTYGWRVTGDARACDGRDACALCLDREAGEVTARIVPAAAQCPRRVDLRASRIRVRPAFADEPPAFTARLFVSEASAPAIEAQLRAGPMTLVAALTDEGRLVGRGLEPAG